MIAAALACALLVAVGGAWVAAAVGDPSAAAVVPIDAAGFTMDPANSFSQLGAMVTPTGSGSENSSDRPGCPARHRWRLDSLWRRPEVTATKCAWYGYAEIQAGRGELS